MNTFRVLLFARVRDLANASEIAVSLPANGTVSDLRLELARRWPALAELLPRCAIGINGEYADDAAILPPVAELAVLPPVSGGSFFRWNSKREP